MVNSGAVGERDPQFGVQKSDETPRGRARTLRSWLRLTALLIVAAEGIGLATTVHALRASQRLFVREERLAALDVPILARRRRVYSEKIIPSGTTFQKFLEEQGLAPGTAQKIIQASRPVYDLSRVHAGSEVTLVASGTGELETVRYPIDQDRALWITRKGNDFDARIRPIPYIVRTEGVAGAIQDSLFQAVEDQGEGDELAVRFADIFGWEIDFNTDPRPGDTFRALVEKKMLYGKVAGYGRILAAQYQSGHHLYRAILFPDRSGRPAYYAPDGKSMQKAFLRSPLRFAARITSGFSYHRFHPILKIYRPHLGIDYAAPVGSRVQAVADGTVIFAGWDGEAGKLVRLRHARGYETLYMHLSRILVRRGQRVRQGQIIALTGATGLATGPHLDFRIEQHGRFRNFLTLPLPPANSVAKRDWPSFLDTKTKVLSQLASLPPQPGGAVQAASPVSAPGPQRGDSR